jgi:mono/diheme cytochrome c family protein
MQLLLIINVGAILFLLVACGTRPTTRPTNLADPGNRAQVALGQDIYARTCASCHGANLEGQPNWQQELPTGGRPAPPHDETGHTWHHADETLFTIVRDGGQAVSPPGYKNNMPAFGSRLSDEEIWAVIAYIKRSWPPEIQALQSQVR